MSKSDMQVKLIADTYCNLSKVNKVFNLHELDNYLYVYIQPDRTRSCILQDLREVNFEESSGSESQYNIVEIVSASWIRIHYSKLDLTTGMHVYKLSFNDPVFDEMLNLYFSYTIQNDSPDKPYIYMNRSKSEGDGE